MAPLAEAGAVVPTFEKAFAPDTIGPGSVSTLVFTITEDSGAPVSDLAFTDTLPAGLTIATPAFPVDGCTGILDAPEGGATISFTDGELAPFSSCQIRVDVTGTSAVTFNNTSGDLTSSAGNSGPAAASLTIATDRPGFTKSFSPNPIPLGGTSTLTFTIDNSANPSVMDNVQFTDPLPTGLEIAGPANATHTCTSGVITATPGGSTISFSSGLVSANASCSVSVEVVATGAGRLGNRTGELTGLAGGVSFRSSGRANAALDVLVDELALIKSFTDDPVPPGGTTTLEFSITNFNRSETATGITFTDDLGATLSGLVATGTPLADPCGAGSLLSGSGLLSLTGGTLGPGETCVFSVTLQVPAGATPGGFPNTTSTVTGTVGGSPVEGSAATNTLFVQPVPRLTKEFTDDPVAAGGTVTLEFSITNTSPTASATNIGFDDLLDPFLGPSMLPVDGFCGINSSIVFLPEGLGFQQRLRLSDAELAPGANCTFSVVLAVAAGAPNGTFPNTTTEVTATVDGQEVTGAPASDDLVVVAPPRLTKDFTDDPVQPGDQVTLEFTLTYDPLAVGDATGIAFTDDLDAALSGLTALGLPLNDVCGIGSQLAGDPGPSNLSLTGGTLAPGESCTFQVTLQTPVNAVPGVHTNSTSAVTATVAGEAATGPGATDDLIIASLFLTKEFLDDPVIPGDTVTLRFTLTNGSSTSDATNIAFQDDLTATLADLAAIGLPLVDPCGAGSSLSGLSVNTLLVFGGGSVPAGTSCFFDVTLQVPADAVSAQYLNRTSGFSATIEGFTVNLPNASDTLVVDGQLLALSKEFLDNPVSPGGTSTLRFTLENLSATETVTGITFTDDLDAALSGLASTSGTVMDICGMGSEVSGAGLLTVSGGSLGPGDTCSFDVTVLVPAGAGSDTALNTTSTVAGVVGALPVTGPAASDTLQINQLTFTKTFDGPTTATGSAVLTFTIENLSSDNPAADLEFSDDLDAVIPGLEATDTPQGDVCGTGSQISGTSFLAFTGGSLDPASSCSFSVTVAVPAGASAGSFPNTTSTLLSNGLPVAAPATATLVVEPPPTFSKVFMPAAVAVGGVSTLTFTVDNTASALPASALAFSDDLPAGLEVADPANDANTCGGTWTAAPGATNLSLTGGTVGAGGTCTVSVEILGTTEGTFVNTSGELTSTSGTSGTATDTLDVVAGEFVVLKSFRTTPVLPGGLMEMELTIVNGSTFPLTDIALTDDLEAAVPGLVAEGLPLADVCGAGSTLSGASVVSLTGGTLAAGTSCTVVVPVRVPAGAAVGTATNTTSTVTGLREGVPVEADPASADLTVAFLGFTKGFGLAGVPLGSSVGLTFEITNPDPANGITDLAFTDDLQAVLPGLQAVNTPLSDVCGAGSQLTGDGVLTLTGGTLGPGGSCRFTVTVVIPNTAPAGTFENVTSPLTGRVDGAAVDGGPASAARANLVVQSIAEIPTLSQWMLLLLITLLAGTGVLRLRG